MTSSSFDAITPNAILADLTAQCQTFFDKAGRAPGECRIDFSMEGRYPAKSGSLKFRCAPASSPPEPTSRSRRGFHQRHTELFSFRDDGDEVEIYELARG